MMKKLFHYVQKKQDESVIVKSEKEESVSSNTLWIHSWSLNEARDALSNSSFIYIPNEIILHIFRFLSVPALCNVSLVCRSFKIIADQDELWKSKCNPSVGLHSKSYKHMYMEWIHEKRLRNERLQVLKGSNRSRTACVVCINPLDIRRRTNKPKFVPVGGFNQHPNSTEELTIKLSVNIDQTVPQLISLLEKASHFQNQWQQSAVLKQMIQRYYRFMQLKASNSINILLIPTLDIEIIWQTHLLRPKIYQDDCLRLFHRIIDHSLIIPDINQVFKDEAFFDTCQLYEQRFGEKYCSIEEKNEVVSNSQEIYSYWDKTHFQFSSNPPDDYENPFSFTEGDIILDGKWLDFCQQFISNANKKHSIWSRLFNKSTELDLEPGRLKQLKKSYERFLYMAAKYPLADGNEFIPPTYAIDIIWHSHMQEPLNYEADCHRLVGYVIYHDPWPIVEDKKMKKSCDQIDRFWKEEFHREIDIDHLS